MRSEDAKQTPVLRVLFDCDDAPLNAGGGEGGGPGRRRRGNPALSRQGFHFSISPKGKWQDLRLDLRKFNNIGAVTWAEVKALRILHMPGGEGRIFLDEIHLERE